MKHPLAFSAFLTFAIRAILLGFWHPNPTWDGAIYGQLARHLADGHGYVHWFDPARATAFYPVGYPWLVSLPLRASVGLEFAAASVSLVAATLTAVVVASTAKLLTNREGSNRAATLAGVSYALLPGSVLWSITPMTETLTSLLMATVLYATLTARSSVRWTVFAGLLTAFASFVRPQSILLAPIASYAREHTFRRQFTACIIIGAVAFCTTLPWTLRNCAALDHCAWVSTNGGSNLYIGTLTHPLGGFVPLERQSDCTDVLGEVSRERCYSAAARRRIAAEPLRWILKMPVKMLRTFAIEWAPASYHRTAARAQATRNWQALGALCTISWWMLLGAATAGGRRLLSASNAGAQRDIASKACRFVLGTVLTVAMTHAVFISDDRYHLPVVPLLCVLLAGLAVKAGAAS